MRAQPAEAAEKAMPSGSYSDAVPGVTTSAGPFGLSDGLMSSSSPQLSLRTAARRLL